MNPHIVNMVVNIEKRYICGICDYAFSYESRLKKHMRVHTEDRPYSCGVCFKSYRWKSGLHEHLKSHIRVRHCEICKKYIEEANFKRHQKIHKKKQKYVCVICSKEFTDKSVLRTHLTIHKGEKPFSCEVCTKSFARKRDLKKHMKLHLEDQPFNCVVCKEIFTEKHGLQMHMRIHTEGPYRCVVCKKPFKQLSHLKYHMRTHKAKKSKSPMEMHSGDKPFCCKICQKTFSSLNTLKRHGETHTILTEKTGYQCELCKMSFRKKTWFTRHMKIHAQEKHEDCDDHHDHSYAKPDLNEKDGLSKKHDLKNTGTSLGQGCVRIELTEIVDLRNIHKNEACLIKREVLSDPDEMLHKHSACEHVTPDVQVKSEEKSSEENKTQKWTVVHSACSELVAEVKPEIISND